MVVQRKDKHLLSTHCQPELRVKAPFTRKEYIYIGYFQKYKHLDSTHCKHTTHCLDYEQNVIPTSTLPTKIRKYRAYFPRRLFFRALINITPYSQLSFTPIVEDYEKGYI